MKNIFDKNIPAIQKHNPQAATQILQATPTPLHMEQSRNGLPIPSLIRDNHAFPLHSRFNPQAEGEKIARGETSSHAAPHENQQITPKKPIGYLVSFGMGAAHHLNPLVDTPHFSGLLIIDSAPVAKAILQHIDLSHILADPRLTILLDPTTEEVLSTLHHNYNPILHGRLATHILRPLWRKKEAWLIRTLNMVNRLIQSSARDTATQNRLGRRWLSNTIANLPLLRHSEHSHSEHSHSEHSHQSEHSLMQTCLENLGIHPPIPAAAIIAAGPTLNTQIPAIESLKHRGVTIISTDTALPFLNSRNIAPHIVISIDAQQASYHHFLDGLPPETVLLLDLASPPALTRKTRKIIFFASAHPLSIYIRHFFLNLPSLDISAGNVTHAALSLCRRLNMKEVHIFGADFCYPRGIPYAVNTYIPHYFHSCGHRLQPSEGAFRHLVYSPGNRRENRAAAWRVHGGILEECRESFEQALAEATSQQHLQSVMYGDIWGDPRSPADFKPFPTLPSRKEVRKSGTTRNPPATSQPTDWHSFLEGYIRELAALPHFEGQPHSYLPSLTPRARQVWATVLPICAALSPGEGASGWEDAREWIIHRASLFL